MRCCCPSCGSYLEILEQKSTMDMGDGVSGLWSRWRCPNDDCKMMRFEITEYYEDIEGVF